MGKNRNFARPMQAQQLDNSDEAGSSIEDGSNAGAPGLLVPAGASIVLHICLLILLHQFEPGASPSTIDIGVEPAGMRISLRPRPEPEVEVEQEPEREPVTETDVQTVETAAKEAAETTVDVPPPAAEQLSSQSIAEQINTEPVSRSPRLPAPALLDVRDIVKNRSENDATARIYNNINCDERQRRIDLIDCGDEDPNAGYNFAAAEQNPIVEFFAELNLPTEDTGNQPADRTTGDARTRASLNNMNGNLGANPLIRRVMGQQP